MTKEENKAVLEALEATTKAMDGMKNWVREYVRVALENYNERSQAVQADEQVSGRRDMLLKLKQFAESYGMKPEKLVKILVEEHIGTVDAERNKAWGEVSALRYEIGKLQESQLKLLQRNQELEDDNDRQRKVVNKLWARLPM